MSFRMHNVTVGHAGSEAPLADLFFFISCYFYLHNTVFISYRTGAQFTRPQFHIVLDWGSVYMRKRYEAYGIGEFSCKLEANPI